MKKLFTGFLLQLQFFTRIPVPLKIPYKKEVLARSFSFLPITGLLIGSLLTGAAFLLSFLGHHLLTVTGVVILEILLTGGLHLDGFADTVDGLYSGRDRDKILEIMKDPNMGTFGVLGLIILILLKAALLYSIDIKTLYIYLLIIPVVSRMCVVWSAGTAHYARKEEGLGYLFAKLTGKKEILICSLITIITGGIILRENIIIPLLLSTAYTLLFTRKLKKTIGGVTGDTQGYIIETTEVIFLLLLFIQNIIRMHYL